VLFPHVRGDARRGVALSEHAFLSGIARVSTGTTVEAVFVGVRATWNWSPPGPRAASLEGTLTIAIASQAGPSRTLRASITRVSAGAAIGAIDAGIHTRSAALCPPAVLARHAFTAPAGLRALTAMAASPAVVVVHHCRDAIAPTQLHSHLAHWAHAATCTAGFDADVFRRSTGVPTAPAVPAVLRQVGAARAVAVGVRLFAACAARQAGIEGEVVPARPAVRLARSSDACSVDALRVGRTGAAALAAVPGIGVDPHALAPANRSSGGSTGGRVRAEVR
jgi:hypothetical protein